MLRIAKECLLGLVFALLVAATLFVHYTMLVDAPTFRYIGY